MLAKPLPATLAVEECQAIEAVENERRYEYLDGQQFEMTGGANNHSAIELNIAGTIFNPRYGTENSLRNSDTR